MTRLGLNPFPHLQQLQCICTKKDYIFQHDPFHALTCERTRYKGTNQRHNLIVYRLAELTRRAGITTEIEVNHMQDKNRQRPDLILSLPNNTIHIVDVTVIHPLTDKWSKTNINQQMDINLQQTELSLYTAEKNKRMKYKDLIEQHEAHFSAAAFHTTGGMSPECIKLLDEIGSEQQHVF